MAPTVVERYIYKQLTAPLLVLDNVGSNCEDLPCNIWWCGEQLWLKGFALRVINRIRRGRRMAVQG